MQGRALQEMGREGNWSFPRACLKQMGSAAWCCASCGPAWMVFRTLCGCAHARGLQKDPGTSPDGRGTRTFHVDGKTPTFS
eukprot:355302-Chlamydomonas_euryale.AAC.14